MMLDPGATYAEADLARLTEIVQEIPLHVESVQARLRERLGEDRHADTIDGGAEAREFMEVMREVDEFLSVGPEIAQDAEETRDWLLRVDQCLDHARELRRPLVLAQTLNAGAGVHVAAGQLAEAVPLLEEAYGLATSLSGKRSADVAIIAMTSLAKVQIMLQDWAATSHACERAIALIERDRYRVNAPFQQAAYLAPHVDVFTAAVFSAWRLGDHDAMLSRMELSKARASIRLLFTSASESTEHFDRELAELGDAINGPRPAADRDARRAHRLELWDQRAIALRDPKAETPAVTLDAVQRLLGPQDAVLYYYWLRPDVLLTTTITSGDIAEDRTVFKSEERTKLEELIDTISRLKGSLRELDTFYIQPLAPLLTPVTGLPLLEGKKRLLISPHRLLHWYPFAAMPYQGRLLVQTFTLRRIPNLTSLLLPHAFYPAHRSVGVAVSEFPGREAALEPLLVARDATEQMVEAHRSAGVPATAMPEPTRATLVSALHDGTINGAWCLHFAGHGHSVDDEISKNAPMESMLDLAEGQVDGYDIATADLGCDVVVLTACDSGQLAIRGRGMAEQPGDELFGLPAAFLQARCRNILAPIWPADEATVSRLVVEFHRNLAQGALPEVALTQAQRRFLDTANVKERWPYFWASLTLTGVGEPNQGVIP
ncbi:CHAT domain-containing protein [Streptantibioticus ferralitis]|uniref:CHAT domain-containing protein n=1 Tax=Streptantibioticus ferralitis TaxID=236510 RepID=A0ABT5Z9B1_9ACTN|nr:CHAT domain-containing tetratricopeptide repeat protein [Streptantibioticus ferralitis]MDF2260426.1 CHAT domain-containing protein [Streptantibioticus ferralitis]